MLMLRLDRPSRRILLAVGSPLLALAISCEPPAPAGIQGPETLGFVEGVVRAEGAPVTGVGLELSGSADRSTVTDATGAYRLGGLAAGTYLVELAGIPAELRFDVQTATAVLGPGSWQARVDFEGVRRREAGVEVEVTVAGEGLAEVMVSLAGTEDRTGATGASGTAVFDGLLPGPYSVTISGWDASRMAFPNVGDAVEALHGEVVQAVFEGTLVLPAAPTAASATPSGPSAIHLAWADASDNEDGFEVERLSGGGAWAAIASPGPGETAMDDMGLEPATVYDYRVRACNAGGCSDWSPEATATTEVMGPNLSIAALTLTQRIQRLEGDVPLVADLPAHLRVYAVATESNVLQPDVEVELWIGGGLAHTETLTAGGGGVPTGVQPASLGATWNWTVPAWLVQPGLSVVARVDPGDAVAEADETDNAFPVSGVPAPLEVWSTPPFDVTFVPVRQSVNGRLGNIGPATTDAFMGGARRMFPVSDDHVLVHAEYVTDAPALQSDDANGAWGTILGEINALRGAEGSARYYYGVVDPDYGGGIAGIGYIGWPAALGWDRLPSGSDVAAHEWGHNMGRRHSPGCGAGNPDPNYPHASGLIGAWGWDLGTATLHSPSAHYDLMTYCGPEWISDYVYERILQFRGGAPDVAGTSSAGMPLDAGSGRGPGGSGGQSGPPAPGLLLWGRVGVGGMVLEPVLPVEAPPLLPEAGGAFRLDGHAPDGGILFSVEFDPILVADGRDGEGHFAFVVPATLLRGGPLGRLELRGPGGVVAREPSGGPVPAPAAGSVVLTPAGGGMVDLTWDAAAHPMVLVRDAASGQVLSFARGGSVRLRPPAAAVELIFSHGLGGPPPLLRSVR